MPASRKSQKSPYLVRYNAGKRLKFRTQHDGIEECALVLHERKVERWHQEYMAAVRSGDSYLSAAAARRYRERVEQ